MRGSLPPSSPGLQVRGERLCSATRTLCPTPDQMEMLGVGEAWWGGLKQGGRAELVVLQANARFYLRAASPQ